MSENASPTPLLDTVTTPHELRTLKPKQLKQLAAELRAETVDAVSQTGGHLGAGLGVVELTVALHYVFNTPEDKIIWDVGHQAYPHKILTGRRDQMRTIRQGGLERLLPADEQGKEGKTFNQGCRDDHRSLDAAGDFRLAGHALQGAAGKAADAVSRADHRQTNADGAAGQNHVRQGGRGALGERARRQAEDDYQAHRGNSDESVHGSSLLC